jgi:hypothetical protein
MANPHISDLIREFSAAGKVYISFEYFPPRTDDGVTNLYARMERMAARKPLYIDVTWGAGGSTSDLTMELCTQATKRYGLTVNMHLTWCEGAVSASAAGGASTVAVVGLWLFRALVTLIVNAVTIHSTNMPEEKITMALEGAKAVGITNIVALRGGMSSAPALSLSPSPAHSSVWRRSPVASLRHSSAALRCGCVGGGVSRCCRATAGVGCAPRCPSCHTAPLTPVCACGVCATVPSTYRPACGRCCVDRGRGRLQLRARPGAAHASRARLVLLHQRGGVP